VPSAGSFFPLLHQINDIASNWKISAEVIIPIPHASALVDLQEDYTLLFDESFLHVQMRYSSANSTNSLRKFAASNARGEFLFFIESSNLLLIKGQKIPQKLQEMVEFMQRNPSYGILGSTVFHMDNLHVNKCFQYPSFSRNIPRFIPWEYSL
jgi:hypothetical protein